MTLPLSRQYANGALKEGIHPPYYPQAKVTCACGNTFTVGSTQEDVRVEICAHCHPFYTGQKKYVDTRGRMERFEKLAEKAARTKVARAAQKAAPKKKKKTEVLTERQWKRLG